MGNFRELGAWQRAHRLALQIYRYTKDFPDHVRYGLTAQLRCAAVSAVSKIAEGASRRSDRELARFVSIARGSVRGSSVSFSFRGIWGTSDPMIGVF